MLNFIEYIEYHRTLDESEVNNHSTHIEDLCITEGTKGIGKALSGLLYIKNQFGTTRKEISPVLTIKWDGSPSFIAGYLGSRFFVASKSLFNKEPKINFSLEDIRKNHSGGITEKLELLLKYIEPIIPEGKIFQGDFLFDSKIRKSETINGIDSWSFMPNTIQYSVDKSSKVGKDIGAAKIGVVFHTEYFSDDPEDPRSIRLKKFGVKSSELKKSKDVWLTDVYHQDLGSVTSFETTESKWITTLKGVILKEQSKVRWSLIDKETKKHLLTFINSYIRSGTIQPDPDIIASNFDTYINQKYAKALSEKKTEKGKLTETKKFRSVLEFAKDIKSVSKLFKIHACLTQIKMMILSKLDSVKKLNTFLVKSDGTLVVTGNEGFVLTRTGATGCKLVDRYNFSLANFSPEFKKGWSR